MVLEVGSQGGKVACFVSRLMTHGEVRAFKDNAQQLAKLQTNEIVQWFKKNCPMAYSKAFRTFPASQLRTLNVFETW